MVAVFDTDEQILYSLQQLLEQDEYRVVKGHLGPFIVDPRRAQEFLLRHQPDVIIYRISPYDESIRLLRFLQMSPSAFHLPLVLTTTADPALLPADLRGAIDLRTVRNGLEQLLLAVGQAVDASPAARR